MNNLNYLFMFTLFAFFLSCSAVYKDIKVEAEKAPHRDLANYKTYIWGGSAQLVLDENGQWASPQMDVNAELRYLVDTELRKKGFTQVGENPELILVATVGVNMDAVKMKKDQDTNINILKNVPQSALIIVMLDAESRDPIWVGMATGEAKTEGTDQEKKKRLEYAVKEILEKLPH